MPTSGFFSVIVIFTFMLVGVGHVAIKRHELLSEVPEAGECVFFSDAALPRSLSSLPRCLTAPGFLRRRTTVGVACLVENEWPLAALTWKMALGGHHLQPEEMGPESRLRLHGTSKRRASQNRQRIA
ncbi:hypothetical protein FNAPI_6234 [Fusarium napiforme]|uniref:Uncharacterized protein n=1 Tax=Fusarium napiforme TaxID=42672 RepID=A0A8H5JGU8_9HYPO|nr:hypothetical protein FNAPI_6234 [Fusarium napiforme]